MKPIQEILKELNESNSSNYKLDVLKKYTDHDLLKRVLSLATDKVKYNFGIGKTILAKFTDKDRQDKMDLDSMLDFLEFELATRNLTGNAASDRLEFLLTQCSVNNAEIIEKIISRDLKINCGRTQINKVFKDLITKPIYMRCDVYSKKTAKNIKFPAFVQLKADGLACFTKINFDDVVCYTRGGEEFILESLQYLKMNEDLIGVTIQGELLVDNLYNRSESNGLINSLIKFKQGNNKTLSIADADSIESRLIYQIWDFISTEDMQKASNKDETGASYDARFRQLNEHFNQS